MWIFLDTELTNCYHGNVIKKAGNHECWLKKSGAFESGFRGEHRALIANINRNSVIDTQSSVVTESTTRRNSEVLRIAFTQELINY